MNYKHHNHNHWVWRLLEGLSPGSMLAAYLWACPDASLVLVCLAQWYASLLDHRAGVVLTDLLVLERVERLVASETTRCGISILTCLSYWMVSPSHVFFYRSKTALLLLFSCCHVHSVGLNWVLIAGFLWSECTRNTTLLHLALGLHSWVEARHYHPDPRPWWYTAVLHLHYLGVLHQFCWSVPIRCPPR